MAANPLRIGDLAEALLSTVTDALVAAGRPVGRAYVSHGAPAWDACTEDQVTVHLSPLTARSSGSGRQQQTQLQAGFVVQAVRCVPVPSDDGVPPTAEALGDSARGLIDDLARLVYAVLEGDVFASCDSVTYGQVNPLGPLGGVAGWTFPLTVTIT